MTKKWLLLREIEEVLERVTRLNESPFRFVQLLIQIRVCINPRFLQRRLLNPLLVYTTGMGKALPASVATKQY